MLDLIRRHIFFHHIFSRRDTSPHTTTPLALAASFLSVAGRPPQVPKRSANGNFVMAEVRYGDLV
jgi:hypothetical protein